MHAFFVVVAALFNCCNTDWIYSCKCPLLVNRVFDLIYLPANGWCTVGTFGLSSTQHNSIRKSSVYWHCWRAVELFKSPKLDLFCTISIYAEGKQCQTSVVLLVCRTTAAACCCFARARAAGASLKRKMTI